MREMLNTPAVNCLRAGQNFLTVANMDGRSYTYHWPPTAADDALLAPRDKDHGPRTMIPNANIQVVNTRSEFKPFLVLTDKEPRIWLAPYKKRRPGEEIRGMSMPAGESEFWWWNHWPVAQLPNDGRVAPAADRPSHSYTSMQDSAPSETTDQSETQIMLCGLTTKSAEALIPLAKSWLKAPNLGLASSGFANKGYDPAERAYVLEKLADGDESRLNFALKASAASPVVNPAFVIKAWGDKGVELQLDGKQVPRGADFRYGYDRTLRGTNLIVWIRAESTKPLSITLSGSVRRDEP